MKFDSLNWRLLPSRNREIRSRAKVNFANGYGAVIEYGENPDYPNHHPYHFCAKRNGASFRIKGSTFYKTEDLSEGDVENLLTILQALPKRKGKTDER